MGNFLNKEWSQHFDNASSAETSLTEDPEATSSKVGRTAAALKKRLSNIENNSGGSAGQQRVEEYSRINSSYQCTPVAASKIASAEFDPRSPSTDIVRTPIFFASDSGEPGKKNGGSKQQQLASGAINDPRSPAYDYKRTPIIHANANKKERQTAPVYTAASQGDEAVASGVDGAAAETTMDSSIMSDSSILLQHVPEGGSGACNASSDSPSVFKSAAASNLPRHILQRKQVEKLNKKKIDVDNKENQD
jgi:hypothetical protein